MSEGTAALMTAGNASGPAITPHTQARDVLTVADSPGSDPARVVVEAGCGILVYPPEAAGEPWRATFTENGRRRFRQAMTEAELAAKLAKVTERLRAGAPDMERPGADLIAHYLDPDRLPVAKRWSRRHADTQRRLCRRFAAPVIAAVTCQDITARSHAADRQRRADRQRGRPAAQVPVGHGDRGHQGRVPGQSAAAGGALAGRRPARARAGRPARPGSPRCGSTRPRSRPPRISASSARPWPWAGAVSWMS